MRIRFRGTRGSIPVAAAGHKIRAKIKQALRLADGRRFENEVQLNRFIDDTLDFPTRHGYGGDSACIQIEGGQDYLLCDMGSGLRRFGHQVMQGPGPDCHRVYHFRMSHAHWDHIMGLPFFQPAYIPGNTINIYNCLETDVLAKEQATGAVIAFFKDADMVIFDAMYSLADMVTVREGWGIRVTSSGWICACGQMSATIACSTMNRPMTMRCWTKSSGKPGGMAKSSAKGAP